MSDDTIYLDPSLQSPITFVDDPSVPSWNEVEAKRFARENEKKRKAAKTQRARAKQKGKRAARP